VEQGGAHQAEMADVPIMMIGLVDGGSVGRCDLTHGSFVLRDSIDQTGRDPGAATAPALHAAAAVVKGSSGREKTRQTRQLYCSRAAAAKRTHE